MHRFQGIPAIYCGLQNRVNLPPYFLVTAVKSGVVATTEQYFFQLHHLTQVDLDSLADDLLAHPMCSHVVARLVARWDAKEQIEPMLRAARVPLDEWEAWVYVLKQTGILYEGVSHAQGSVNPPRQGRRKVPA